MKSSIKENAVLFLFLLSVACSGDGGGQATGATETGNSIGAAVQAVFGGDDQASRLSERNLLLARLADFFMRRANAQDGPTSACDMLDEPPDPVSVGASIEPGTYGAPSNPITLGATDDCEDGGEYATFTVSSHSLDCVDGEGTTSTLTMVDSSGVWRENQSANRTEIYGTFNMQLGGETANDIRCSLIIQHAEQEGGGEFSGVCEDADGNAIDQTTDLTCTDNE